MLYEWGTKREDLALAKSIIDHHYPEEDAEIGLQDVTIVAEGSLLIERAFWIIELEQDLALLYGEHRAEILTKKITTLLLTGGDAIH